MLAYVIALKLALKQDNTLANNYLRILGYEGLKKFVDSGHLLDDLSGLMGLSLDLSIRDIIIENIPKAETIISRSHENRIEILTILDEHYPTNLSELPNCPTIIYVRGKITGKYEKAIGCVGTRNPSIYGIRAIDSLVSAWSREGFVIVSGLAEGIDTRSHTVCLEQNGTTIAVLAQGLDDIYPKKNKKLAERIVNSGGLLISEYPVGESPKQYTFVRRNEWIVGLSKGIVVFEAKVKSGTMHSVSFAQLQKKPIFCPVPVDITIPEAEGINFLLESKKAIGIKNRREYGKLIKELGYSMANCEQLEHELVFSDMREHLGNIKFFRDNDFPKRQVSINLDEQLYLKINKIAESHGLTVQEVFDTFRLAIPSSDKGKKGE